MHHQRFARRAKLILLSLLTAVSVKADPGELTQTTLTRNVSSGFTLQTSFSKNAYRTETYQETENYYVNVPYEDTETYTDYETQYSNEYICRNYTDYERQCHMENDCGWSVNVGTQLAALADLSDVVAERERPPGVGPAPITPHPQPGPGPAPHPQPAPQPHPQPAPQPHPQPAPQPHPQPAPQPHPQPAPQPHPQPHPGPGPGPITPHPGPGPQPPPYHPPPTCHQHEVCVNVPVTRQQCGYEQVAHTVPVTRTRTVIRYRQELRQRVVTRTRDVFDHQWSVNVVLQFPADAILSGNQQENIQVNLVGNESAPDVSITPIHSIYGYQIVEKHYDESARLIVTLQTVALQNPDMAALQNDSNISANIIGNGDAAQLSLIDLTQMYASVNTRYVVSLVRRDANGKSISMCEKSLARAALQMQQNGNYLVRVQDLGMSASDIGNYLQPGQQVNAVIEVDRSVANNSQQIQFWKDNMVTIK